MPFIIAFIGGVLGGAIGLILLIAVVGLIARSAFFKIDT